MKANFGTRPFAYAEGQQHRDAAEAVNDVLRDIRESFGHLPFHAASDSESDSADPVPSSSQSESARDSRTPPKAPCKVAEPPPVLKGRLLNTFLWSCLLLCGPVQNIFLNLSNTTFFKKMTNQLYTVNAAFKKFCGSFL